MIRALNIKDAARLSQIHGMSFERGWSEAEMHTHLQSDLCFGYGRPAAGFIIVRAAPGQAEILTLAIDPAARRQGLARQILDITETELADQGVDTLFLEVAEDNAPAIAFYKAAGFEPIGRRPAYYRREKGRVAALTYRKRLDAAAAIG